MRITCARKVSESYGGLRVEYPASIRAGQSEIVQKCILVRDNHTKGETRHNFTYLARELDEEALGDQDGNQEQTAFTTMEME